ncbi:protein TonB [Rhodoblastus acidophilus]|uniref:cell envelope integrity protein TolA n=1 Tax=Rhodoblastus acidophilus TaxID=1074 RepID=UPI0022250F6A|nr:TonB family protein [Rhodoblastus acidophilus]MCW2318347.1 protein TonB [Rhodoblastus acidophilus]
MTPQGRNVVTAASPKPDSGKRRLAMSQAFGLSLILHLALAAPLIVLWRPSRDTPPETLTVDLDGLLSDRQAEAKTATDFAPPAPDRRPEAEQAQTPPAAPPQNQESPQDIADAQPQPPQQQPIAEPHKAQETPPAGALAPSVSEEGQAARTLSRRDDKEDAIRKYGARLVKKVQARLIVPGAERASGAQGEVKVFFAIAADGSVDPASVKVIASSGRRGLDAAARATITKSAPFPPPPEATTVAFSLFFGKK